MNPARRAVDLAEDWKFIFQRDGFKAALPVIGREIAGLPYRRLEFHIITRSLDDPLPDLQAKIPLEIRPFEPDDVERVRVIDRPSEARHCAQRLLCGQKGLIALNWGRPAGYGWGCAEENPQIDTMLVHLDPGSFLCTDVYTAPAFRRQGIQTALSLERFKLFRDLGFRQAVCYIEVRNAPSLAVWQKKLGGKITGHIDFVRLGPWYRVRLEEEK